MSTYLERQLEQIQVNMEKELNNEKYNCSCDVNHLQKMLKRKFSLGDYYYAPLGVDDFIFLVVKVVFFFQLCMFYFPFKYIYIKKKNEKINKKIEERELECQRKCLEIQRLYEEEMKKAEEEYTNSVENACKMYGASGVMAPVINWLCECFEKSIFEADRGIYIKEITAELVYTVESDKMVILDKKGYEWEKLEFQRGIDGYRYSNLNGFIQQIGFAKAVAKHVEFEMSCKFACDPIASSTKHTPQFNSLCEDTKVTVIYKVANPNYRELVSFDQVVDMNSDKILSW